MISKLIFLKNIRSVKIFFNNYHSVVASVLKNEIIFLKKCKKIMHILCILDFYKEKVDNQNSEKFGIKFLTNQKEMVGGALAKDAPR
jgi:hypothetical protein